MKVIFFYLSFLLIACGNVSKKEYTNQQDRTISNHSMQLDKELLQGVWSENKEENALFFIKGDSLLYVEDQNNPYEVNLRNDTLFVYASLPFECKIIKLTEDSLCYIDNITNEITRLVKIE